MGETGKLYRPGPRNLITDVAGLHVGHATDEAVRSGATVLRCDRFPVAAVDVRGGGPATRETDLLDPARLIGRLHALVFSGGSVFGLAAADGVVAALSARQQGLHLQQGSPAIPLVPAACLHDLGNGGDKDWGENPPYRMLGRAALRAAGQDFALGAVGAGRGAMAGVETGGVGSASLDLGEGLMVGALVVVNCIGSVRLPGSDVFWAWPLEVDGEFGGHRPSGAETAIDPLPADSRLAEAGKLALTTNTTLAVVATNAALERGEVQRLAMSAHDGFARAIRPAHTPFDGDTAFAIATEAVPLTDGPDRPRALARIASAASDTLARAIARGVHAAR